MDNEEAAGGITLTEKETTRQTLLRAINNRFEPVTKYATNDTNKRPSSVSAPLSTFEREPYYTPLSGETNIILLILSFLEGQDLYALSNVCLYFYQIVNSNVNIWNQKTWTIYPQQYELSDSICVVDNLLRTGHNIEEVIINSWKITLSLEASDMPRLASIGLLTKLVFKNCELCMSALCIFLKNLKVQNLELNNCSIIGKTKDFQSSYQVKTIAINNTTFEYPLPSKFFITLIMIGPQPSWAYVQKLRIDNLIIIDGPIKADIIGTFPGRSSSVAYIGNGEETSTLLSSAVCSRLYIDSFDTTVHELVTPNICFNRYVKDLTIAPLYDDSIASYFFNLLNVFPSLESLKIINGNLNCAFENQLNIPAQLLSITFVGGVKHNVHDDFYSSLKRTLTSAGKGDVMINLIPLTGSKIDFLEELFATPNIYENLKDTYKSITSLKVESIEEQTQEIIAIRLILEKQYENYRHCLDFDTRKELFNAVFSKQKIISGHTVQWLKNIDEKVSNILTRQSIDLKNIQSTKELLSAKVFSMAQDYLSLVGTTEEALALVNKVTRAIKIYEQEIEISHTQHVISSSSSLNNRGYSYISDKSENDDEISNIIEDCCQIMMIELSKYPGGWNSDIGFNCNIPEEEVWSDMDWEIEEEDDDIDLEN